jgi:hypothetical protein
MREMIWVKSANVRGWACSECAWAFSPSGPPRGNALEEMKQNYERQREKEFATHVCAQHPRAKSPEPGAWSLERQRRAQNLRGGPAMDRVIDLAIDLAMDLAIQRKA